MKKKKKCSEITVKFTDFQNNSLPLSEMYEVNEHLKSCQECRNELETILLIEKTKRLLSEDGNESYDLSRFIYDLIREKERYINKKLWRKTTVFLLFALALLIVALLLFTPVFSFLGIDLRIM